MTAHTRAQRLRFADVEDVAFAVLEEVHARPRRQLPQLAVNGVVDHSATSSPVPACATVVEIRPLAFSVPCTGSATQPESAEVAVHEGGGLLDAERSSGYEIDGRECRYGYTREHDRVQCRKEEQEKTTGDSAGQGGNRHAPEHASAAGEAADARAERAPQQRPFDPGADPGGETQPQNAKGPAGQPVLLEN